MASLYLVGLGYSLAFCAAMSVSYYLMRVWLVNGVKCPSNARLVGKTVVITGGNTGIGKMTAKELAARGGKIIIACRDAKKGDAAVEEIVKETANENVFFKRLDLASCASVRRFAEDILRTEPQIDVLLLNAGVMFTPYQVTEDGFEFQFGVNHLGHFLLTHLLLDRLKASAPSRVVVVSSLGHRMGTLDFDDMMWKKSYNPGLSYCRSKLANVMFAREFARQLAGSGVTVCSLHPGTVYTEITRHLLSGWLILLKPFAHVAMLLFTKTATQGSQTSIYCAVAGEVEGQLGAYYDQCRVKQPCKEALDDQRCRRLWDYSRELLNLN